MIPFDLVNLPPLSYHWRGKKNPEKVCDNIFCFDIETSSFFVENGKVYTYRDVERECKVKDKRKRYKAINDRIQGMEKGGLCYLWQFGADGVRMYGRDLHHFKECLDALCTKIAVPFICFIHNSAYEYEWLRGVLGDDNIEAFYTEARKPLYFKYLNCEFRCTYRLTNSSLAQWGKKIGLPKLDTLDYGELYTPKTELPAGALEYSERDIEIMHEGLLKYVSIYGNVWNIPYTQTGQARADVKELYHDNWNYHKRITDALPIDADEYRLQQCVFMGGMCFSGVENSGRIIKGPGSYDRASAYPYQVVANQFPAGRFRETKLPPEQYDFKQYHYIMWVEFSNVEAKTSINCIPASRMRNKSGKGKYNNGKLINFSGTFQMFLTEVDLQIYEQFYTFDLVYLKTWVAISRLLDIDFVKYVLKLYGQKTTLKGVDDRKDEYQRGKELLNSASYGMSIQKLVYENHRLENNKWIDDPLLDKAINAELEKRQNCKWKNILAYHMGIYITAYQRRDLLNMVAQVKPSHFCYTDTDSIKLRHPELYAGLFAAENKRITERLKTIAELREIDFDLFQPKDQDGERHLIGIWENEGVYKRAVFLGSKRYCYEVEKKGKVETHVVVSGVPKAAENHVKLEDFRDGFVFAPEDVDHKKSILCYLDGNNPQVTVKAGEPDEYKVDLSYAICMYPTGYDMTLTREYKDLIELYKNQKGAII